MEHQLFACQGEAKTAMSGWSAWYGAYQLMQTANKQQQFRVTPQAQPVAGSSSVEPVTPVRPAMYVWHSGRLPRMTMQQTP